MNLILIEWLDPASAMDSGWKDIEELKEQARPVMMKSVGWVLDETEEYLLLAAHIGSDQCDGDLVVPRSCVVRVEILRDGGENGATIQRGEGA